MTESPEVSVLMTVRNGEAFLEEAIESVRAQQTSALWELILVDDGSTDGSRLLAERFARHDSRIKVLSHPQNGNLGISASRNLALQHARGEILAFLDADDVWLPYRLEHQLNLLRAQPEIAMIYGQAERWWDFDRAFDEAILLNGRNYIPDLVPEGETAGTLLAPKLLRWFLSNESLTPCTCSVLVRAEVARRLGGFEDSFRGLYDDQVFYAKVSLAHPVLVDTRCVARYRRHPGSCCFEAEEAGGGGLARGAFVAWLTHYVGADQQARAALQEYLERANLFALVEVN